MIRAANVAWPVMALAIVAGSPPAAAQTSKPVSSPSARAVLDIPEQDLSRALLQLGRRTAHEILFSPAAVRGKRSPRVRGSLTVQQALSRMLRGTGLAASELPSGKGWVIRPGGPARPPVARPAPPETVDETPILVTARKRPELAIDVPIALAVVSGEELQARNIRDAAEYFARVPGVNAYADNGNLKLAIRGISTTLGGNENGYYLDDMPVTGVTVPIVPNVRAWDLDRIEVLRGPQGTLFGEGSIGGTVRILTKNPSLDTWEGVASTSAWITQGGDPGYGVKAAINAPIIDDVAAFRVSATREQYGGWRDNPATDRKNENESGLAAVRARLQIRPGDRLTVNGLFWSENTSPIGAVQADDALDVDSLDTLHSRLGFRLAGVSLRYNLGRADAFYSYTRLRYRSSTTGTFYAGALNSRLSVNLETQEFRINSRGNAFLQWTIGAYQRRARRRDIYQFELFDISSLDNTRNSARAAFGEVTYTPPGTSLSITGGLRLFRERVSGFEVNNGATRHDDDDSLGATNPRFGIAWHPSPAALLYVSVAKGFRSSQFQPQAAIATAETLGITLPRSLSQDYIWSYELGGKAALLNGALSLEGAAFHSRWRNVAVRIPLGDTGLNGLVPSKGIASDGVEISVKAKPSSGLLATLAGSYIDSRYLADVPGTALAAGSPADDVARFTTTATLDYTRLVNDRLLATARIAWQHNSRRSFDAFADYAPGDRLNDVSLRLGLDFGASRLTLFADNLLNDAGAVSYRAPLMSARESTTLVANRLTPRTIGFELFASFAAARR
jgi:iron complex outermembrane recepter protein